MELTSKYDPKEMESEWYEYWLNHKLFSSKPSGREPYTVTISPPNVTGVLHMGYMPNSTIQDILVRRAHMESKDACRVPGTGHASIAAEAEVAACLKGRGINKTDLPRDEFLEHTWDWMHKHGGITLRRLRRLGASRDWGHTTFTMDEKRPESVIKVFCDLYNKEFIYRGMCMVNWDPQTQTTLSDREVIYKDEHSKLYCLRYNVMEEPGKYAVVMTTCPEAIMGNTTMCIDPNDPRNQWLRDKHVIVSFVNREIPMIEDDYTDIEFETDCLKVTPAHDINDHALGLKHGLQTTDIFNDNGTLSETAGLYMGMDRMEVRKQIAEGLERAGLIEKMEDYDDKAGYPERMDAPTEPKLSTQQFLKMQHFANLALQPVMDDDIQFCPLKYKNTYRHWLESIRDWCIGRQLRRRRCIPTYYFTVNGKQEIVVTKSAEEALEQVRKKDNTVIMEQLEQDNGYLDIWLSSWLWPIPLSSSINHPDNEKANYYCPTADLTVGPDITFFWVARMIMTGYGCKGQVPFKRMYFTDIARGKPGRKMNESPGNSPDPVSLIDQYGTDGVRMSMILSASTGNDILFGESLCKQGRSFNNKIWNASRLVEGWEVADGERPNVCELAAAQFKARLCTANEEMNDLLAKYRISGALTVVYRLFWGEFSSWYPEMVRPAYGTPIDRITYKATLKHFDVLLKMLHPFISFITEELWQYLHTRAEGASIMREKLQTTESTDTDRALIEDIEEVKQIVSGVRTIRNQKNISSKGELQFIAISNNNHTVYNDIITEMANPKGIETTGEEPADAALFMVGTDEFTVPVDNLIDVAAELKKQEDQLKHFEGFLAGIKRKPANEKSVASIPEAVAALERKKQSDSGEKIAPLHQSIVELKNRA